MPTPGPRPRPPPRPAGRAGRAERHPGGAGAAQPADAGGGAAHAADDESGRAHLPPQPHHVSTRAPGAGRPHEQGGSFPSWGMERRRRRRRCCQGPAPLPASAPRAASEATAAAERASRGRPRPSLVALRPCLTVRTSAPCPLRPSLLPPCSAIVSRLLDDHSKTAALGRIRMLYDGPTRTEGAAFDCPPALAQVRRAGPSGGSLPPSGFSIAWQGFLLGTSAPSPGPMPAHSAQHWRGSPAPAAHSRPPSPALAPCPLLLVGADPACPPCRPC